MSEDKTGDKIKKQIEDKPKESFTNLYRRIQTTHQIGEIKKLANEMGYGHLMCIASALWRKSLKESGTPESGAFYPTIVSFIQDKYIKLTEGEIAHYDKIIEEYE